MAQTQTSLTYCPRCQMRIARGYHTGDFIHACPPQASEALRNEDILVIGAWTDYTGSDAAVTSLAKGTENTLQGTRASIEGDKFYPVTSRGFPKNRFRTRQHLHFIPETYFETKGTTDSMPEEYEQYKN